MYARHVITVWDLGLNNLSGSRVDIDGVTIQEGRAFGAEDLPPNVEPANEKRGGGINILESKVALLRCTIIDCDALEEGGGVSMYDRAVHPGGSQSAPYVARLDMVNCLVTDCQGRRGGGVANAETTSYLVNTIIRECRAIEEGVGTTGTGGALLNWEPQRPNESITYIDDCTFHNNFSEGVQGVLSNEGSIHARNSLFWDGATSISGGDNSTFQYCTSANGFPVYHPTNSIDNPLLNADSTLVCNSPAVNTGYAGTLNNPGMPGDDFDLDGDNAVELLSLDFADHERVVGKLDRGALELPREPCASDVDGDGVVDVNDLIALINNWGCGQTIVPCPGDINGPCDNQGDGVVNVDDLLLVINNWGIDCGAGASGEGLPQSYTDCSNLCAQYSGQAWADCMQACFKILCEQGQTEYCDD